MEYFYRYIMTTSEFQTWKLGVIHATGLSRDALHIYLGLAVFLTARLIFGDRRWSGPLAWLIIAALAVLGEVLDYGEKENILALFTMEVHVHDIVNTLFWPTVLLIFGPFIFAKAKEKRGALPNQIGDQDLE